MPNERQQRAARAEQMRKEREKADRKQRNVITIAIVAVVVALIAVGGYAIQKTSSQNKQATDLVAPKNTTKDYGIVYDTAAAGGKVSPGAKPVSVELYEDFQCPACLAFERAGNSFLKDQIAKGAITITYRPFSFLDENRGSPNQYSHRSTNVALCALDVGGVADYVKVHDLLYQNQPQEGTRGPENAELLATFKAAGITGIDTCVRSGRFIPWVDKAKEVGVKRGVNSTPTVYVAGKIVEAPSPATLQKAITAAAS